MANFENKIVRIDYSVLGDTVSFRIKSKLYKDLKCKFIMYKKYNVYLSSVTSINYNNEKTNIYLATIANKKCFKVHSKDFLKLLELFKYYS